MEKARPDSATRKSNWLLAVYIRLSAPAYRGLAWPNFQRGARAATFIRHGGGELTEKKTEKKFSHSP